MSYKFTYFDGPWRGEPARLLFAAAGMKFEDNRVKMEDWPVVKAALGGGQVPVLEVEDKKLTQSKAIYRYLARKFKLMPEDEWEMAQCDEMVDSAEEIFNEYVNFEFKEQDATKKEEMKKTFVTKSLPAYLAKIDKLLAENGGTWLIGKSMTWADIVVAEWLRQLVDVAGDSKLLDGYPHVKTMKEAVFANSNIVAYFDGL